MANVNTQQVWNLNSALQNTAAVADFYDPGSDLSNPNDITAANILANDPGSASFVGLYDPNYSGGTTPGFLIGDPSAGSILSPTTDLTAVINSHLDDPIYSVIRLNNGTFSLAPLNHPLFVEDFTSDVSPSVTGHFAQAVTLLNWTNLNGVPTEVLGGNSTPTSPPTAGDAYHTFTGAWSGNNSLDTQASPGGIDIQTTVQTPLNAVSDTLSITLSPTANIPFPTPPVFGGTTAADAKLDLLFNGQLVHEFTLADFTTAGQVNWNNMVQFTFNVADNHTGHATIELHDVTPDASNVGFAVDTVGISVQLAHSPFA